MSRPDADPIDEDTALDNIEFSFEGVLFARALPPAHRHGYGVREVVSLRAAVDQIDCQIVGA